MYLFKNLEKARLYPELSAHRDFPAILSAAYRKFLDGLTGDEKPHHMLMELALLVLLLHIWGLVYSSRPAEPTPTVSARPPAMQVSLIAAPDPPATSPAPPEVKPLTFQKKSKPIRPFAQKKSAIRKTSTTRQSEPTRRAYTQETAPDKSTTSADAPDFASPAIQPSPPPSQQITKPDFSAKYGFTPEPEYPLIARDRGWEGKVLLRVRVSAEGISETVAVHRSSGYETLDESAVAAVKKWRFIPARHGDMPMASSVYVPILFTLNN